MVHAHLCHANDKFHHKSVERSTYGIMFLGTPHEGTDATEWATLLLGIQSIYSETNNAVLRDLRLHSPRLQQQLSQYSSISRNYKTKFFFEMYDTPLFGGFKKRVRLSYIRMPVFLTQDICSSFPSSLRLSQGQLMQSQFLCTRIMLVWQSLRQEAMGTSRLLLRTYSTWSWSPHRRLQSGGSHTIDMKVRSAIEIIFINLSVFCRSGPKRASRRRNHETRWGVSLDTYTHV